MTLYRFVLFAHILGVLGLFIGMGLQWTIVLRLRRAQTVAQVREWGGLVGAVARLGPASGVLILGAGAYLMAAAWGLTPWIAVSLAAMAVMLALGMGVTARRLGPSGGQRARPTPQTMRSRPTWHVESTIPSCGSRHRWRAARRWGLSS